MVGRVEGVRHVTAVVTVVAGFFHHSGALAIQFARDENVIDRSGKIVITKVRLVGVLGLFTIDHARRALHGIDLGEKIFSGLGEVFEIPNKGGVGDFALSDEIVRDGFGLYVEVSRENTLAGGGPLDVSQNQVEIEFHEGLFSVNARHVNIEHVDGFGIFAILYGEHQHKISAACEIFVERKVLLFIAQKSLEILCPGLFWNYGPFFSVDGIDSIDRHDLKFPRHRRGDSHVAVFYMTVGVIIEIVSRLIKEYLKRIGEGDVDLLEADDIFFLHVPR